MMNGKFTLVAELEKEYKLKPCLNEHTYDKLENIEYVIEININILK